MKVAFVRPYSSSLSMTANHEMPGSNLLGLQKTSRSTITAIIFWERTQFFTKTPVNFCFRLSFGIQKNEHGQNFKFKVLRGTLYLNGAVELLMFATIFGRKKRRSEISPRKRRGGHVKKDKKTGLLLYEHFFVLVAYSSISS